MAEVKNAFIKSKMNKDLDDRLLPSGEYRDALNVQVSKSEASDVGALENVFGNIEIEDFALPYAKSKAVMAPVVVQRIIVLSDTTNLKVGMIMRGGFYGSSVKSPDSRIQAIDIATNSITLDKNQTLSAGNIMIFVYDITCIGYFSDEFRNNIYSFFTDFTDNNTGNIPGYNTQGENFIFRKNVQTGVLTALAVGSFLNFSKTQPIIGVNLLEDLLFFTDNRNQPRKINVNAANTSNPPLVVPTYYSNEDQISVAKYNPYECIRVLSTTDTTKLLGSNSKLSTTITLPSSTKVLRVASNPSTNPITIGDGVTGIGVKTNTFVTKVDNLDITTNKVQDLIDNTAVVFAGLETTMKDVTTENFGVFGTASTSIQRTNPTTALFFNNSTVTPTIGMGVTAVGFPNNLIITSIASSTQAVVSSPVSYVANLSLTFIDANPYFDATFSGDPDFLQDKFVRFSYRFKFDDGENSIFAPFTQPCFIPKQDGYFIGEDEIQAFSSTIVRFMENKATKIELQIPLPATGTSLISSVSPYKIKSIDILYKESDGLAVQVLDTVPVDAIFGAATGANNVYQYDYESTKPFKTLPSSDLIRVYDKIPVKAFSQEIISNRVVYGNFQDKHTPPASLDYQAAVSDKYSKDSAVGNKTIVEYPSSTVKQNRNYQVGIVLSDKFGRQSSTLLSNNTSPLTTLDGQFFGTSTIFSPYQTITDTAPHLWPGDSLKILFNEPIDSLINTAIGTPGLYDGDPTSATYNPLGWYSYKVVIQQKEQDYYNVYNAGAMLGIPVATDLASLNTSYISLVNDNINKVPRDLSEVGPLQKQFRSSVILIGRVQNTEYITTSTNKIGNRQFYPGSNTDVTSSIEDLNTMFDTSSIGDAITDPTNPYFPFFKSESNPLIAQITTTQNFGLPNLAVAGTTNFQPIQNLAVFETEPDLSRLDFYFETSTSGLISELNLDINLANGSSNNIVGFNLIQTEALGLNEIVTPDFFFPVDVIGARVNNVDIQLIEVTTGTTIDENLSNNWSVQKTGSGSVGDPHKFKLLTANNANGYQYYAGNDGSSDFTFTFRVINNLNTDRPDGDIIVETGSLINEIPGIIGGSQTINLAYGTIGVISTQSAVNGSNPSGGNSTRSIDFDKVSGASNFTITAAGVVSNSSTTASGQYAVVIRATDAGGLISQATLTINLGPTPVGTQFNVDPIAGLNGDMITYYYTNQNQFPFNDINDGANIVPNGFRQKSGDASAPTELEPSKSGFDCESESVYAWLKERKGDYFQSDNNNAFFVSVSNQNKISGTTMSRATVQWRENFDASWEQALDIEGRPARFGMVQTLPGSYSKVRYIGQQFNVNNYNSLMTLDAKPFFSYDQISTEDYGVMVTQVGADGINTNEAIKGSRIFAFNGQQNGKTSGEYRLLLGNFESSPRSFVNGLPNGFPTCPPQLLDNANNIQGIQVGDANYGSIFGDNLPASEFYSYRVSVDTVAYNSQEACGEISGTQSFPQAGFFGEGGSSGNVFAREFITKYVTQFYTDAALTNKLALTAGIHSFGRIGTGGNHEGTLNGLYQAEFNTTGLRTAGAENSSIACTVGTPPDDPPTLSISLGSAPFFSPSTGNILYSVNPATTNVSFEPNNNFVWSTSPPTPSGDIITLGPPFGQAIFRAPNNNTDYTVSCTATGTDGTTVSDSIVVPVALAAITSTTKIFMYFDSSGSMGSVLGKLQEMRDTLLKPRLVPGVYTEAEYNANVLIVQSGSERTFNWLNFQGAAVSGSNAIAMVFQDEATDVYTQNDFTFCPPKSTLLTDIATLKSSLDSYTSNFYQGFVFQIGGPVARRQTFGRLLKAVSGNPAPPRPNGPDDSCITTTNGLAAYQDKVSYIYDVPQSQSAEDYLDMVVNALEATGINVPD